jgi:hypothetical protein
MTSPAGDPMPDDPRSPSYPDDWIYPDDWTVPGNPRGDNGPDDWVVPPSSAMPSMAQSAFATQPNSPNPSISIWPAPPPDPLAAYWSRIPASRLAAVVRHPPIFPDALGRYPLPAPAPANPPPPDIPYGLLVGVAKATSDARALRLGLLGGLASQSADKPWSILGSLDDLAWSPPPTAWDGFGSAGNGPVAGNNASGLFPISGYPPLDSSYGLLAGMTNPPPAASVFPNPPPSLPTTAEPSWFGDASFPSERVGEIAGDTVNSLGAGVGQGFINNAALLGDARELLANGVQKAANLIAPGAAPHAGEWFSQGLPSFVQFAPTSSQLQDATESVTGPFHRPQTVYGEYARTVGEFAPSALVPEGGLLWNAIRYGLFPALASETAGQLTKGSDAERWVRGAAAIVATGFGAWRHLGAGGAAPEIPEKLPARSPAPLEGGTGEAIGGQLPSEQVSAPAPENSAATGHPASDALPQADPTASSTTEDGPSRAEQLKAQRVAQLKINNAAGAAYEKTTDASFDRDVQDVASQITVELPSGARTRVDYVSRNRMTGELDCIECKSSPTARMTPKQTRAFPEMEQHEATIVGKGKPGFPGGTKIPPKRVEIRRPRT